MLAFCKDLLVVNLIRNVAGLWILVVALRLLHNFKRCSLILISEGFCPHRNLTLLTRSMLKRPRALVAVPNIECDR